MAHDTAKRWDATLHGGPVWQPEAGKVGGALLLDGVDDYLSTGCPLNPSDGPLSAFLWAKGGAPGQALLSQANTANWLMAAAGTGGLATELKPSLGGSSLSSTAVITDGEWHRVGVVYDDTSRILYVDGAEVAKASAAKAKSSTMDMYIGTGTKRKAGTFWSGLIDDVRIYNRAMKP